MINPVQIEIGSKTYRLRFNVRNKQDMAKVGLDTSMLSGRQKGGGGLSVLRTLFWGSLAYYHKDISKERAGELLQEYIDTGGTIAELDQKVSEALTNGKRELKI